MANACRLEIKVVQLNNRVCDFFGGDGKCIYIYIYIYIYTLDMFFAFAARRGRASGYREA